MVSGSPGSQKEQGSMRVAEFPGMGVGKPAENSESRCWLSDLCCHKIWTAAWSCDHYLRRSPAKSRSVTRATSLSCEEQCGSLPQEFIKFGVLKLSGEPKIKITWSQAGWTQLWQQLGRQEWLTVFLWGFTKEWGLWTFSSGAERVGWAYSSAHWCWNVSGSKTLLHSGMWSHLHLALSLHKGGSFAIGQVPFTISTTGLSPRRPMQTIGSHQVYIS